jgi:hypothetical protein
MSARGLRVAAVVAAATALFGCSGGDDSSGTPPPPAPPSFTRVTREVMTEKNCGGAACHSLNLGGFTLAAKTTLYGVLVDQPAAGEFCGPNAGTDGGAGDGGAGDGGAGDGGAGDGGPRPTYIRVIPGDPDNSLLYLKLKHTQPCGEPMPPPPAAALGEAQVQLVYDWIALGAKND